MILNDQEKGFLEYWEANRLRKKKVWRQLSVGLPASVALVATIMINMLASWHKEADKVFRRESSSLVIVLVIACLLIVVFFVIFSAKHRWDMNEQQYKELKSKAGKP